MEPGFCKRAAECGLHSFQIMAGALDRTPVTSELLSYEGPFGVGYGVAAFTPTGTAGSAPERDFGEQYVQHHAADMREHREAEEPWVELARRTPEPVDSTDALDCRCYGVIVSTVDGRCGLLLPDLDDVDTVDEQLRIAARKGGIDLGSDRVRLERFTVTRHE